MIAQTIQLAMAPVFMLVALGQILNALSFRFGRIIDRSRELQVLYGKTTGKEHDMVVAEIRGTDKRIALVSKAIHAMVWSGIAVGATVALLFIEEIAGFEVFLIAASIFMIAIALLMWALILFLRETQVSTQLLRIPRDLLELDKPDVDRAE